MGRERFGKRNGQERGEKGYHGHTKMWDLDSSNFHLSLENKLRQSKASFNSKKLKLYFQSAMRMTTTEPCDITGYRQYEEEGEKLEALPMSIVSEF